MSKSLGSLKFLWKNNWFYVVVGVICFLIMIASSLSSHSTFEILKRLLFEPGYKENFLVGSDTGLLVQFEPTVFNIMKYNLTTAFSNMVFDTTMIFGTIFFQLLLPLFATVSGVVFYERYHSILRLSMYKEGKNYSKIIVKQMLINACKLAGSIFLAYVVFFLLIRMIRIPNEFGALERALFSDLFGKAFYREHVELYFLLEGFVKLFMIPFAYCMLTQSIVLLDRSSKEVIASPLLYFFGFSAIGAAVGLFSPTLALYINPTVLMASGSYNSFYTLLLVGVNMIPLLIGGVILYAKTKSISI